VTKFHAAVNAHDSGVQNESGGAPNGWD